MELLKLFITLFNSSKSPIQKIFNDDELFGFYYVHVASYFTFNYVPGRPYGPSSNGYFLLMVMWHIINLK